MKKRIVSLLGAAALLVTGLAGCARTAPAASTAARSAFSAQTAEFEPKLDTGASVTLDISGFFGNFEALDRVVNNFNEYYPNVAVSYEANSGDKLVDYLNNNPYADIVMTDDTNFRYEDWADYYVLDRVADLSAEDIDLSAVQEDLLEACTYDGRLARLPIGVNLTGMAVNKTLLRREGLDVPATWQEFLDVCEALKQKGYTSIQGSESVVYAGLVYNMGMTELGRDPTLISALNDSEETAVTAVSAVYDRLEELLDKGYTDPAVNAEYPADNYDGAILRFFEGNVPFWVCSTENYSGMKKRESKSESYSTNPFDYEFMDVPVGDNGVYEYVEPWFGFSVNKASDNYDYAVEFLRFLAREDQLDTIASVKGVPSAAKAGTDERYASVRAPEKVEAGYVNTGNVLNHMKDYFRNEAGRLGTGETATAEQAARSYVRRCAEVAAAMAESGTGSGN